MRERVFSRILSGLTTLAGQDDNPRTVRSVRRAIVSLIVVPYVAFAAMIAPAHVHEADADHPRSTAHRHFEPHHSGSHDQIDAQRADDDGHVVWLDAVTVQQAGFHLPIPAEVPQPSSRFAPLTPRWTAIRNYDTAPPHGPPRASPTLRGPPSLSA